MEVERWFAISFRERVALAVLPLALGVFPLINRGHPHDWLGLMVGVACLSALLFVRSARVGVVLTNDAVIRSDAFQTRGTAWVDIIGIRVRHAGERRRTVFAVTRDGEFAIAHSGMRRNRTDLDAFLERVHQLWGAWESEIEWHPSPRPCWKPTYDGRGNVVLRSRLGSKFAVVGTLFGAMVGLTLGDGDVLPSLAVLAATFAVALVLWQSWSLVRITPTTVDIRRLGFRAVLDRADIVDVLRAPDRGRSHSALAVVDGRRNLTVTLPAPISFTTSLLGEDPQFELIFDWLRAELLTSAPHGDH